MVRKYYFSLDSEVVPQYHQKMSSGMAKSSVFSVSGVGDRDFQFEQTLAKLVQAAGGEFVGIQTAFPSAFPAVVYLTPFSKTQMALPFDPMRDDVLDDLSLRIRATIVNSKQDFETRKISVPASTINRWVATISSLKQEIDDVLGRTK